jgi:hypothetical protein
MEAQWFSLSKEVQNTEVTMQGADISFGTKIEFCLYTTWKNMQPSKQSTA